MQIAQADFMALNSSVVIDVRTVSSFKTSSDRIDISELFYMRDCYLKLSSYRITLCDSSLLQLLLF